MYTYKQYNQRCKEKSVPQAADIMGKKKLYTRFKQYIFFEQIRIGDCTFIKYYLKKINLFEFFFLNMFVYIEPTI